MPNYTISIPKIIYERMKQYPEIKWSEIIRQSIEKYLNEMEFKTEMKSSELLLKLGVDLSEIPEEKAIEFAIKSRKAGEKRVIQIQEDE